MTQQLRIKIEGPKGDSGLMFATSPDHRGLLVAGYSKEDLEQQLPHALHNLYAAVDRYIHRSIRTETGIDIEFERPLAP